MYAPKAQMFSSGAYRKSLRHAIFLFSGCIQWYIYIYVLLRAWRPCRATALSGQSIVYACIWQMMLSFYAHYDGTLHSALELCVTSIQICLTIWITNIQWCSDHSVLLFVVSPMCQFLHVYSCITNVWVSSCIQLYHQCVSSFMYTVVSPMCEFLHTVVPRYNTVVGSMKWNRVIHGAWYSILC